MSPRPQFPGMPMPPTEAISDPVERIQPRPPMPVDMQGLGGLREAFQSMMPIGGAQNPLANTHFVSGFNPAMLGGAKPETGGGSPAPDMAPPPMEGMGAGGSAPPDTWAGGSATFDEMGAGGDMASGNAMRQMPDGSFQGVPTGGGGRLTGMWNAAGSPDMQPSGGGANGPMFGAGGLAGMASGGVPDRQSLARLLMQSRGRRGARY